MTKPMPLADFTRLPPLLSASIGDGLASALDTVADRAAPTHRFLRYGWFAAALHAYGGAARTLTVMREGTPLLALPLVATGPAPLRVASVPGCYWPFRSFPVAQDAGAEVFEVALDTLARHANALRIGPVYDGDPALEGLRAAAAARGWVALDRFVAESFLLDMAALQAEGTWPRNSTLRRIASTKSISPNTVHPTGASSRAPTGPHRHSTISPRSSATAGSPSGPTGAMPNSPMTDTVPSGAPPPPIRSSPRRCGPRCCASTACRRPSRST